MGYNPETRRRVLAFLDEVGVVVDRSGHATGVVAYAIEYSGKGLGQFLQKIEGEGLIVREVRGKRCYMIRITAAGRRAHAGDDDEQRQVITSDRREVTVPTIIIEDQELVARLARQHEYSRSLETKLTRANDAKVAAEDLAAARGREIAGLRDQLRQAEDNLARLIEAPHDREQALQALDRIMRERPRSSMAG